MMNAFHKYHALGNDYIVVDPAEGGQALTPETARLLCHRHFGVGGDGILWGPLPPDDPFFAAVPVRLQGALVTPICGLRILNPDGSEAEKSGNGLRIFCRYLWDIQRATTEPFAVVTLGGIVQCQVLDEGAAVRVDMGRVSFHSKQIPMTGEPREVVNETMSIGDREIRFSAATIGNPHCIIVQDQLDVAEVNALGPLIERHPSFPNRTNVQFMKIIDRANLAIEIWERGAGYTLASGSSASACAATARRLDMCDSQVTVHMPGGTLDISVSDAFDVVLTGPVTPVAHGTLAEGFLKHLDSESRPLRKSNAGTEAAP